MLTISPRGGLCNRLLALHSAMRLSNDLGRPLRVLWAIRREFGCAFTDLFELPPLVSQIVTVNQMPTRTVADRLHELTLRYLWPMTHPQLRPREVEAMRDAGVDFRALAERHRHPNFITWSLFYGADTTLYAFEPKEPLRRRVEAVVNSFGHTVGVHIRRTDHRPAITYSTIDMFERRMAELVEQDPATNFFVATDSPSEVDRLRQAFPGRIVTSNPSSLSRAERGGIEAAVVDLYALASTTQILGSFASTFSDVAGMLGNIPVTFMVNSPSPIAVWRTA